MSQHSFPQPPPQPGALCTAYTPLLPLLSTDGLAPDEVGSLRAHLTDCDWCRARLAEYDTLYGVLRRQFGPDAVVADVPSVRAIAARGRKMPVAVPVRSVASHHAVARPLIRSLPRVLLRAEVAALLVVALVGALLAWQRGILPGSPAPLDPQARAYLAMLHADYQPVLDALGVDDRQCVNVFTSAPQTDKRADMLACKPVEQTVVTASRALLTGLAQTPPPPRWQTADGQLTTWANALIKAFTDRIQAIDARDTARFAVLADSEVAPASNLSCTPIQQINADLPADSRLPASASGACGS
jgi:hypothetical protein